MELKVNLRKSIKLLLADKGENAKWLSKELCISPAAVSKIMVNNTASLSRLSHISAVFGVKLSEFIALGED